MIQPGLVYKVRCMRHFKDGNLPPGFQNFVADREYEGIPGNILMRLQRSDPGAFEVVGKKPKEAMPEIKDPPVSNLPELSPAAEKLIKEHSVPVDELTPTGKNGVIIKADVEKYLAV